MSSDHTTKICTKCGKELPATREYFHSHRNGLRPECKMCHNKQVSEWQKQRRKDNPDLANAASRRWHAKNKEHEREYRKRYMELNPEYNHNYYQNNKEKISKQTRDYYFKNRDRILIRNKIYRDANREKIALLSKKWVESNRAHVKKNRHDYYLAHRSQHSQRKRAYRHAKRANGGSFTEEQIAQLHEWQNYKCIYCGADISKKYDIDHFIPIKLGGTSDITNIFLACHKCNCSKGAKHPFKWYKMRDFV